LTKRDDWALRNRTRSKKPSDVPRTVEERTWPTEARISALVSMGCAYSDAWDMSPRDANRYLAIESARAIPPKERVGQVRRGKPGQSLFG
jgi:hypothetical protein